MVSAPVVERNRTEGKRRKEYGSKMREQRRREEKDVREAEIWTEWIGQQGNYITEEKAKPSS